METRKLPVGVDGFEKLRREDLYYVDKTAFIKTLLHQWGEANLITRPRRFGKTLNMKMLQAFFEIDKDHKDLFTGLAISKEKDLCLQHMNKYPVIFLSLKEVEGKTFESAMKSLAAQVSEECTRLSVLNQSPNLSKNDHKILDTLVSKKASQEDLCLALKILCRMLETHHKKKALLLIDEYDVPLDKAFHNGYYDEMISFLRRFLGSALKTNDALKFAVVTGCLRISKESIFTGVNNLKMNTIMSHSYNEHFGFTDAEVRKMLEDYGLDFAYNDLHQWYNGYRFGNTDIYCPWDVINYVDDLLNNPKARPKIYWVNTSSNDIVRRFIDKANSTTVREIEKLVAGEPVKKVIQENLTYGELEKTIDNLWSVLFLTGYLTRTPDPLGYENDPVKLLIPNRAVQTIFVDTIQKWFKEKVDSIPVQESLHKLYRAFLDGDSRTIGDILRDHLLSTISYHDYYEGYYHGFLTGLLTGCNDWSLESNREAGTGRSDLLMTANNGSTGIVIEVKRGGDNDDLLDLCKKALAQIEEKRYYAAFKARRITQARLYGIAFWGKTCEVVGKSLTV